MRFLVDAQLPPALARWLGERGLAAVPVRWTIITKDEDFIARCVGNPAAPAVVWLRIGNCTNRILFAWLEPFLPEIKSRLAQGETFLEVR